MDLKNLYFLNNQNVVNLNFSDRVSIIMGVPKQKHTKSRRNKRRSQIFLKKPNLIICSKCKKPVLPHMVCLNCGYYQSQEVIDVFKKLSKKEKKQKEKEVKEEEKMAKKKNLSLEELSQSKF